MEYNQLKEQYDSIVPVDKDGILMCNIVYYLLKLKTNLKNEDNLISFATTIKGIGILKVIFEPSLYDKFVDRFSTVLARITTLTDKFPNVKDDTLLSILRYALSEEIIPVSIPSDSTLLEKLRSLSTKDYKTSSASSFSTLTQHCFELTTDSTIVKNVKAIVNIKDGDIIKTVFDMNYSIPSSDIQLENTEYVKSQETTSKVNKFLSAFDIFK